MAKRLSEKQKEELVRSFICGKPVDQLSKEFNCTKLTITRNLKKNLGEKKYKDIINNISSQVQSRDEKNNNFSSTHENDKLKKNNLDNNSSKNFNENKDEELFALTPFMEITPLDIEIENKPQKDLSSVPISDISFPRIVYMIVDKKIELEIKLLKDFPEWQFLPQDDLSRKTIEIFFDLNLAKRSCNKEQKVLKVPNTDVFRIAAPILIEKGISRIVCAENLIAL